MVGLGLGCIELRFELIAEGHEFVDFGDDTVLFWKWGEWNGKSEQLVCQELAGTVRGVLDKPQDLGLQAFRQ